MATQRRAGGYLVPEDYEPVPVVSFQEFRSRIFNRRTWQQAQHVTLIGTTGQGKTSLFREIAQDRSHVAIIDVKGPNSSLKSLPGFTTIEEWPSERHGWPPREAAHVRLAPPGNKLSQLGSQRRQIRKCLENIFEVGGWCVYVDELRTVGDPKRMDLGHILTETWIRGREPKNITLVVSIQSPRWVPHEALDQPTHFFLWRVDDEEVLRRVAEMGVDTPRLRTALRTLDYHSFVYVSRLTREMWISNVQR